MEFCHRRTNFSLISLCFKVSVHVNLFGFDWFGHFDGWFGFDWIDGWFDFDWKNDSSRPSDMFGVNGAQAGAASCREAVNTFFPVTS